MDVHVGEAWDKEFAAGVEDFRAVRNREGFRRAERHDVLVSYQHGHVLLRRRTGSIDYSNVGDSEGGVAGIRAPAKQCDSAQSKNR
jgi:hypothetical protein